MIHDWHDMILLPYLVIILSTISCYLMKTETDHLKINWTDSINCAEGSWVSQHMQSDVSIAQSSVRGRRFCSNWLFTRLSTSHRYPKLKAKCDSSSLPPLLSHETEELPLHLSLNHQFLGHGGPHQAACGGKVFGWGGASGEPTLWVSLFGKGAHKQTLHGWLTVCPWQLVICHHWAAFSGGNVINFTLPSSEISPINHPWRCPCAGLCCRPAWQIFTWFLHPRAPRGYRRRERVLNRRLGWHVHLMTGVENNNKMR